MFTREYKGPDAELVTLVQFVWREVVCVRSVGFWGRREATAVAGAVVSTGGTYDLTLGGTDTTYGIPTSANLNVDATPRASDPFYEGSGAANRTPTNTLIVDAPSFRAGNAIDRCVSENIVDPGSVLQIISRFHAHTYTLVRGRVAHVFRTTVEWKIDPPSFAAATGKSLPPGVLPVVRTTGQSTTGIPSLFEQVLHRRFPRHAYIR